MLGQKPQAGSVSWMIPVCHAYKTGGRQAAYDFYAQLEWNDKNKYIFQDYELLTLVFQLMGAGNLDAAIDILNLNIQAFPNEVESYNRLADMYHRRGEFSLAENVLLKALSIHPDNFEAAELLEKLHRNEKPVR